MVVKCSNCGQYFTHTKEDTKCPFCHTEYGEVLEKTKEKKENKKTKKESFTIWKDN